ncbi:MAG TPA: prepilin-type N-terminal cleavage/methylation domain-containing protein [Thermoanaerobaculia bacterium]|nr:prepilin-type N-terminal cleavage/methylation domain-containing protein [Thermoanaerobaculia bacterium]
MTRRAGSLRSGRGAGFTLIEVSVALVLLLAGLLIAADLLMETARLFTETSGEALDTPVPLAIARIRDDIVGSTSVIPQYAEDGKLDRIRIGVPGAEIDYEKVGDSLYRLVVPSSGPAKDPATLWRGVTDWSCTQGGTSTPVWFSVTYQRRTTPHTPLAVMPLYRGALAETRIEKFYVLPRGGGW